MPLLLLIVFGILEYGLLFRTSLTISDASRAGARVAVAQPRNEGYQGVAADTVSGSLASAGIPADQIDLLVVYKADPTTGGLKGGGSADADIEACLTNCWKFTWDAGTDRFTAVPGGPEWPAEDQAACGAEDSTDYLGVYIRARHVFVTGFFQQEQRLSERTVMRLEPLPFTDECKPIT